MAERVGLFARLKFMGDSAVASMGRASRGFKGLARQARLAKSGMNDMQSGLRNVAMAGAAINVFAGAAVKKFADFAGQMGTVRSVMLGLTDKEFTQLTDKAKMLGATTQFTAKQAGEAMENLARSGMSANQIMAAISPTLSAAAADGLDLGSAANIVASNLKAFVLPASDAARVADVLATVSAKTNTNMTQLQEGLKFAAPVANKLGISIEDTAASLGILADVGLKGTLGGTALKTAMLRLSMQAKKGSVTFRGMRIEMAKNDKGNLDLAQTFANVTKAISKMGDKQTQAAAAAKLLGLRGLGTEAAFSSVKRAKVDALYGKIDTSVKGATKRVGGLKVTAKGAADAMAKMRLNNIKGDFVKLSSAVDGAMINLGGALASSVNLRGGFQGLTRGLGQVSAAFAFFEKNPKAIDQNDISIKGVSKTIGNMVAGVLQGMKEAKAAIGSVAKAFGSAFGMGSSSAKGTAKMITKVLALAAAFAPLAIAIKGASFLFGGLARTALGATKVVAAAIGGAASVGGSLLSKVPGIAKVLPGVAGRLFGAVNAVEQLTATPVRVVNMPGGLAGSAAGVAGAAAGAPGVLGRVWLRLKAIGGMNVGAALLAAGAGLKSVAIGAAGLARKFAGPGMLVAAAGAAGYAIGTLIDRTFGLSDKISTAAHKIFNAGQIARSNKRVEEFKKTARFGAARSMAQQLARLSQKGTTTVTQRDAKGKLQKRALTKDYARERIAAFLKTNGLKDKDDVATILRDLKGTLDGIKDIKVSTSVNIDGKKVASAVSKKLGESKTRGAGSGGVPNSRRRAAVGAT